MAFEAFEKNSILFTSKGNSAGQRHWTTVRLPARARGMDAPSQRENCNHRHTLSISRIELKLHFVQNVEPDAGIGQKGAFFKGLDLFFEAPKLGQILSITVKVQALALDDHLAVFYTNLGRHVFFEVLDGSKVGR